MAAAADGMSSPLLSVSFIGLIFDSTCLVQFRLNQAIMANSRDMPFGEIF